MPPKTIKELLQHIADNYAQNHVVAIKVGETNGESVIDFYVGTKESKEVKILPYKVEGYKIRIKFE